MAPKRQDGATHARHNWVKKANVQERSRGRNSSAESKRHAEPSAAFAPGPVLWPPPREEPIENGKHGMLGVQAKQASSLSALSLLCAPTDDSSPAGMSAEASLLSSADCYSILGHKTTPLGSAISVLIGSWDTCAIIDHYREA